MGKILLVDDDPQWRKDMAWAAGGFGREIVEAENEEVAIRRIAEERFDVVVTDLGLRRGEPDTGGLEVLKAAREKDVFTQVIVCTIAQKPTVSIDAMRLGAFDYQERVTPGTDHLNMLKFKIGQALEFRDAKLEAGRAR